VRRNLAVAVLLLALTGAGPAYAADFFLLDPNVASPGDRVTITSGAAGSETRPIALTMYLVRNDIADDVAGPDDPRLIRLGVFRIGRRGDGSLSFVVPALPRATYTVAYRRLGPCSHVGICGEPFYAATVNDQIVPRYRARMVLRVESESILSVGRWYAWLLALAALVAAALLIARTRSARRVRRTAGYQSPAGPDGLAPP
jgi:hypothetical protein